MVKIIDINCDVGEGVGNDAELLPLVTSCNIACGGHTGDEASIRATIRLAKKHKVKIGAHPSYPDKENFGRKVVSIAAPELQQSLEEQLETFARIIEEEEAHWHHIKPHGALYNVVAKDDVLATVFLEAVTAYTSGRYMYAPPGSRIAQIAINSGCKIHFEAFADRNYNKDLSLVSRKFENAVITSPKAVLQHLRRMVLEEKVKTISGEVQPIQADTFCVHGDTATALEILMYLHEELPKYNIQPLK